MRIKNKLKHTSGFCFVGSFVTQLKPGELSQELPVSVFFNPGIRRALDAGAIEVQFSKSDVVMITEETVAKNPGIKLEPGITLPIAIPNPDAKPVPKPRKKSPTPKAEVFTADMIRAGALAKDVGIPFRVLSAALFELTGKRFSSSSGVTKEQADKIRDRYVQKTEIPDLFNEANTYRGEVRTLSDLAEEADGILSLDDLIKENNAGGFT